MKKLLFTFLIAGLIFTSCSEDDDVKVVESVDQPVPELDNSSAGIYVGLAEANTCYFQINLKNGGEEVKGTVYMDGTSYALTPQFKNYVAGTELVDGEFIFDKGSILFSVEEGGYPSASLKLEDEEDYGIVNIYKSKSEFPIHIYTGTVTEGGIEYVGDNNEESEWSQVKYYNVLLEYENNLIYTTIYELDSENKIEHLYAKSSSFTIVDDIFSTELIQADNMLMNADKIYSKTGDDNYYFEVDLTKKADW